VGVKEHNQKKDRFTLQTLSDSRNAEFCIQRVFSALLGL